MSTPPPPISATAGDAARHALDEGTVLWTSYYGAFADYMAALCQAREPTALWTAYAQFVAESFNVAGRAAGQLQRYHGALTPTLNDA